MTSTCVEDEDVGSTMDTLLKPTILGYHLVNHPYSLAKMQQANTNLYGNTNGVAITNKYVRFKPSSPLQLSILEDMDIDLFDYPLDYEVVQHGDYYNDGVTPAEEIPWLYTVFGVSFVPPSGITYEELEQIHIPTIAAVENEAFRITGNPFDDPECESSASSSLPGNMNTASCDEQVCPPDYNWDPNICECVPITCPPGFHWDGNQCVPDGPPAPVPARQPAGTITVFDNNLNVNRPVRSARIVAKRFLKIERTYTNNQGQFFLNKEFNKVRLLVKFKNDQAKIKALRRARLWQMLFPVERNLGKFRGTLNNIQHDIPYTADARSDGARHWTAATAHNNVQEFRDLATQQGIGLPPNKIRILLTNWRLQGVSGAAPMFAKRFWADLPVDFLRVYVISQFSLVAGGASALVHILKYEIDITAGYNLGGNDVTSNADPLSELLFHELAHAAHYSKVGNSWWANFVNAEISEMIAGPAPYGNGGTTNSPIIALGESWAYHAGHFLADLKYGANSGAAFEQGIEYHNGPILEGGNQVANTGLNAHLNLLEDFSPNRVIDQFRWIPQGLFYDLIDNRNDNNAMPTRVLLNDNVMNYNNFQFFNALDQDISSLPGYRIRLLNENGNNQAADVNIIFAFYNVF